MHNQPARAAVKQRQIASSPAVSGFRPGRLSLALAAAFAAVCLPAQAQPTGAQAIHGSATLTTQGNQLTVTTQNGVGTAHSAINWQSFSVPAGSTTRFNQPSATSTSINRVVGNDPSAIFGTLSSNGRLVLVNPAGIAVGAGAVVDTAGFTASSLRMTDADALAGRLRFGQDGQTGGAVFVQGRVLARNGDVVLIAPQVQVGEGALIQSPNGATVLAAGQKVEVTGRGLEGIRMEVQAPTDRAVNLGTLQGDAVGLFAGTLRHSGLIQATAATAEGGKVVLKARDQLEISGSIAAQRADGRGGSVHAAGDKVTLTSTALVDVSGAAGGGEALIGGGWQGGDARLTNARETTVHAGARINADATASGNGGTVVVWSDGDTRTAGDISAQGGLLGGNGGQVETSGKRWLDVRATPLVNARTTSGRGGDWLLDPNTIIIGTGTPAIAGPVVFTDAVAGVDSYVAPSLITAALNAGSTVTIKTAGNASTLTNGVGNVRFDQNVVATAASPGGLLVYAHADITVSSGVTVGSTGGAMPITMRAGYAADVSADAAIGVGGSIFLMPNSKLQSNGGAINLQGKSVCGCIGVDIYDATVNAGAGNLTILGASDTNTGVSVGSSGTFGSSQLGGAMVSITGSSASTSQTGVDLYGAQITGGAGGISVTSAANNVYIGDSTLSTAAAGGAITVSGVSANSGTTGVDIASGTTLTSGAGALMVNGQGTGFFSTGVYLSGGAKLTSTSGAITVTGNAPLNPGGNGVAMDGASVVTGSGPITINSADSSVDLYNTTLSSSGGNIAVSAASSASEGGALTISGAPTFESVIQTLGSGTIQLTGNLATGNVTAGSPGGLLISDTTVSSASGAITLTGNNAVNLSGPTHYGLHLGNAATVTSGTGNITLNGTVSNAAVSDAYAVRIDGRASTGGSASVTGNSSAIAGAAVYVGATGSIVVSGSGPVSITGTAPASAVGPVPPNIDVSLNGSVSSGGGEITISGNRVHVGAPISSATGRTMIKPTTLSQPITLGSGDEELTLNMSSAELDQITASVIIVGGGTYTGGITVNSPVAPPSANSLSLVSAGNIGGTGRITVPALNADGAQVNLSNLSNGVETISGRATAGPFLLNNSSFAGLTVGTVDGISGIIATGPVTLANPNSSISQTSTIAGSSLTASAFGGIDLSNTGNLVGSYNLTNTGGNVLVGNNSNITALTVVNQAPAPGPGPVAAGPSDGRVDIRNTGSVVVNSINTFSVDTGITDADASVTVKASGAITRAPGPSPQITTGGSVFLQSTGSGQNIGANAANRLAIDAGGPLVVQGGGGTANANISLLAASQIVQEISGVSALDLVVNNLVITPTDATRDAFISTGSSLTINASGSVTLTAASGHAAKLTSGTGGINITASSLVLNKGAAATEDAVIFTSGALTRSLTSCVNCDLLRQGEDPFSNTVAQSGLLASNNYTAINAADDSVSVPTAGGMVSILANDSYVKAEDSAPVVTSPATTSELNLTLGGRPPGVSLDGSGNLVVDITTPDGVYAINYTACAVISPSSCVTRVINLTKGPVAPPPPAPEPPPPPAPVPPPPAPVPPPPPPPAPVPPPPPPPAPVPPPPPPPAPVPPPPPPPAPVPPPPPPPAPVPPPPPPPPAPSAANNDPVRQQESFQDIFLNLVQAEANRQPGTPGRRTQDDIVVTDQSCPRS